MRYFSMAVVGTIVLLISGCGDGKMSTKEISEIIKPSMQQKFDTDSKFKKFNFKVGDVVVVKQVGNSYQGLAKITYNGSSHDVSIEVTADDSENVLWKTLPGEFGFVAEEE